MISPAFLLALTMSIPAEPAPSFSSRLLAQIDSDYWDAGQKLYREHWSPKGESQVAFNWAVGVMLSALNAMADKGGRERLDEYLKGITVYWNAEGPVPGFDVLPCPKPVDRYYDDNAWMVLSLFESHAITKNSAQKDLALKALEYCLSGESDRLGGGIYWRESDKASKNTCANSPIAAACFEAYQLTKEPKYVKAGERIIRWTMEHLQDPEDLLMYDNINLEGKVEKTKWSYNSALTAKALILAKECGVNLPWSGEDLFRSAWKKWFQAGKGMSDIGKFAHLLVDVGLDHNLISDADKADLAAQLKGLQEQMRYGDRWNSKPGGREKFDLIDQASVLRTLGRLGV